MEVAFHILRETKESAIHCQDLNAASSLINVIAPRPKTSEDLVLSSAVLPGGTRQYEG